MASSRRRRVLVTGAAGFIGGYVVREFLGRGWAVGAMIHRLMSDYLREMEGKGRVRIVKGDVGDKESFRAALADFEMKVGGIDVVVHCAAHASDVGWRSVFKKANYDAVTYLGRWMLDRPKCRLVYVSTSDVYGLRDFRHEREEDLSLCDQPKNPYPEFKIASEQWIRTNLPRNQYSIVRPASVWGLGDTSLTKRAVDMLGTLPWIIHFGPWKGKNRWPLAHVRNVAAGIYMAATRKETAGKAFHILDPEYTTIDDFYRMLLKVYFPGQNRGTLTLPMWVGKVFGWFVTSVSNLLNLRHPFTDPTLYAVDIISYNLDFSERSFMGLMRRAKCRLMRRQEGLAELKPQDGDLEAIEK